MQHVKKCGYQCMESAVTLAQLLPRHLWLLSAVTSHLVLPNPVILQRHRLFRDTAPSLALLIALETSEVLMELFPSPPPAWLGCSARVSSPALLQSECHAPLETLPFTHCALATTLSRKR